ncbi:unnamed protein product [Mytilus coruscus]|uniref:Uncharacterized protein n=1 Tax=Mytilus coruscus TaxID=42192 RepID=A0A6J8A320_MYTCO|nr:unnamed protein product [Mytilus coruscus]
MDKKLGWIPYPKRATGVFYNEVLQSFYKSYWPYCPHAVSFQQAFIVERNRRWQWNKKVNGLKQQILTFKSSNPATAGRYLDGDTYKPHKNDADNINRLLHDLNRIKDDLDIAMSEIRKQDDSLFRSISGKLKSGRDSNHEFNEELINNIRDMLYDLESTFSKLSKMKELFVSIWKHKFHNTASEKKIKQRTRQNNLGGDPIDGEISPSFGINQITEIEEHALNSLFGTETCTRDKLCLQNLIDEGCFRMGALDTTSNYIQD